ncbi:MAG: DNA repair protein RecN [Acholeplasmataceae bacterium]|nr:DNA repair protein RecN [Acholeplasmataceae bacterium]
MLATLNVKNFAIIDNIKIDFNDGLTVLTGETGAGKSLIIDAISLLFGERASNDLIRYGEDKATIEGLFSNYDSNIKGLLNKYDIDYDESDYLIVKRELYASGKNICKINNQNVTLNQLKEISMYIGDIHSQLETFGLINPKNYILFLHNSKTNELLELYENNLKKYRKAKKEYDELISKNDENTKRLDFIKYQLNELTQAKLSLSEEEELKNESKFLSNFEDVSSTLFELKNNFLNDQTLSNLYESLNLMQKLSKYDEKYLEFKNILEEAYYNIEEVANDKSLSVNVIDFDERRLDEVNERLAIYSELKRKYKMTTEELIAFKEKLENTINEVDNFDFNLKELEKNVNIYLDEVMNAGNNLHEERVKISKQIMNEIMPHLLDLQLNNTLFEIDVNNTKNLLRDGLDEVNFNVTFNKGEPVKPLSKIASGGELSRFMLALKTVLGDNLPMQTKIFDEIDSGVSGNVAYSIGKKLHNISKTSQVLCITHLPQVASVADHHIKISKTLIEGRTITKIDVLDYDGRVQEIASMISNGVPTEASLNYAKELLNTI